MPSAIEVTPAAWSQLIVLYDYNGYSVVYGVYDGTKRLGLRWNGQDGKPGQPQSRGNPIWLGVPYGITSGVLFDIECSLRTTYKGDKMAEQYLSNIETAKRNLMPLVRSGTYG